MISSWEWQPGFPSKGVKAETAGAELEAISRHIGRVPNARDVVSSAKRKTSVLHPLFTWNNGDAAGSWREEQARNLMRSIIKITYDKGHPQRAHYRVSVTNGQKGTAQEGHLRVYPTREAALKDPKLRMQIVTRGWDELTSWAERYGDLPEFERVRRAIQAARKNPAAA